MLYLVYKMRLTESAQRNLKQFWSWLEAREQWFYQNLPMVKGVRWYSTVIGEVYTLECWSAFDSEADYGAYRAKLAELKQDSRWESMRTSQVEWWTFIDSRLLSDVPCRVGFGEVGQSTDS
jgi:hypothetical protein